MLCAAQAEAADATFDTSITDPTAPPPVVAPPSVPSLGVRQYNINSTTDGEPKDLKTAEVQHEVMECMGATLLLPNGIGWAYNGDAPTAHAASTRGG